MSTPQTNVCYDELVLERLLSEQLQGDEEVAVLQHIETCEQCRDTMANIAGAGELEGEMQQHFSDHAIDSPGAETVLEYYSGHDDIDQIKTLLGPTDDPYMLGRLGCYEISGIVGRGSTGVVFKALDKGLNRFVAIKMLAPSYAGSGAARQRFAREARSIAAVQDVHVIPVFAVDEHQGLPFIVMEYMPAGSLEQRIQKEGSLDTCEVARIGMQIASALAAAHKQGIIHRDVKPANVLLADGVDRALVTDFGLARILDEASMTRSGAISGTPQFMSPEQAAGETVGHQSDLFSLGSVMYMACTGHSPFRSETVFGVIKRVCETEPRPIRETTPNAKQWLCDFINKLHAKKPIDRFQSAQEVADALAAELAYLQSPATVPKPERSWRPKPKAAAMSVAFTDPAKLLIGGTVATGALLLGLFAFKGGDQHGDVPGRSETAASAANLPGLLMVATPEDQVAQDCEEVDVFFTGMELHDAGKYAEAIELFKQSVVDGNRVENSTYNIACGYALLGQKEKALNALKQAFDVGFCDQSHFETDSDLDSLRSDKRFKNLVTHIEHKTRLAESLVMAKAASRNGKFEEAEKLYLTILEDDAGHGEAAGELGYLLHRQGKLDEAYKWHQKAAESSDFAGIGNFNLACYYSLQNQPEKAFPHFEVSLETGFLNFFDMHYIDHDADIDVLRDDPRYEQIMQKAESRLQQSWSAKEKDCKRLLDAITKEDTVVLAKLLQTIDPNCSCPDYRANRQTITAPRKTPIGIAAKIGNVEAAKQLITANAKVSYTVGGELTPLMTACKFGHLDMVKYFVANGAKVIRNLDGRGTALTSAASGNHIAVMEFLLDMDADINARVAGLGTPLLVAAKEGNTESVRYLVSRNAAVNVKVDGVGTALAAAGRNGQLEVVAFLLQHDADIDLQTPGVGTALSTAVRATQIECAKLLLKAGADVNARADGVGTPLTVAAANGDVRMLQFLIDHHARIDQPTPGVGTALSVAAKRGHVDAVQFLLENGANANATGPGVGTPLACAVRGKDVDVVTILLDAGADPNASSPGSKSAIDLARRQETRAMLHLLNADQSSDCQ